MRRLACHLSAFILLASWPLISLTSSEDLAVVVAARSPIEKLSAEAISLIFTRKSQVDHDGNRWIPVNLPPADPARRMFSKALFGSLPEDMEEYWNIEYFHGITPPEVLASEEAVLRFVAVTPGAIGYVHSSHADKRVKILALIPHLPVGKTR